MPQDDQSIASLTAKLRADIRAELEASFRTQPPAPPAAQVPAEPVTPPVAMPGRIPGADGRPELVLPASSAPSLTLPAALRVGLSVAYRSGDSARALGGGQSSGLGFTNANVAIARDTLLCFDVRRFFTPEPPSTRSTSVLPLAVVGDKVSAGIYWIHPALLDLVSGTTAPKQADGVTVTRLSYDANGASINAVRIAQQGTEASSTLYYDIETGLLLSQISTVTAGLGSGQVFQTYLSKRQLKIPWSETSTPDWVATTRTLTYEGNKTLTIAGATVRQTLTLTADLEKVDSDVYLARITSLTDSGSGFPADRIIWQTIAAASVVYPLWIAPAVLRALKPHELIDEDPVTGFRMSSLGIDGDYAAVAEEAPLERTTYFFDVKTGMFSGLRGERPFGDGAGTLNTDVWLRGAPPRASDPRPFVSQSETVMTSSPTAGAASGPDKVDLRDLLWPVENLGQIAASAASAAATALEYHCNRMDEQPTQLSSLFIHYNARLATGQEQSNSGTTLEAAMKAIAKYGACPDVSWPLDASKSTSKPPAQAYDEARKFSAVQYSNPADMLEALALHYPVPFVARVPERCLVEAGRTGIMPAPTPDELQRGGQINHAMVLVGYDKIARTVTARNCWGTQWGDKGHCAISFDIMKTIAPAGSERLWIITKAVAAVAHDAGGPVARPLAEPPSSPPERLADMAARMRSEIRADLQRDLAESATRIREMLARPPAAPPAQVRPLDTCSACSGGGACWSCGGKGCNSCGSTGRCPKCNGRGTT